MFRFKKKTLITSLAVCLVIIFISSSVPAIRQPLLDTVREPFKLLTFLRRELGAVIFYHRNFTQNEKLQKEADFLRNRFNTLIEISKENTRLKDLLALKQKSPLRLIAARVIARSADNWSSSAIIDKGRHHGIRPGMVAMTYLGLAGRVIEASGFTSKVLLINDPNIGVSSLVQRTRQEGLVCGTLGPYLIMRYLSGDSDIKVQDTIISSGLADNYPKGLLIGRVIDIGSEFSGLSHYAIIKPAVNLSSLEEVLIVIK